MSPILIRSLYSGYGKNEILHGIDFEARDELTVIVGSNGSGKSTLLKSIFGLCDVRSGTISALGHDITGMAPHRVTAKGISYMAQTSNVFYELDVRENLIIASIPGEPPLDEIFELFADLKEAMGKKAGELSGGQRQMLAMAMALARHPKIMMFDEPTANLSPKNASMVLDRIKEVQRRTKSCVILVEQNVKNALDTGDSCCLFSGGNIIYRGDPEKLLADEDLASKYLGVK